MNKNIIILGSNGMLGQMVKLFFTIKNFNVQIFDKRFSSENFITYLDQLNNFDDSIIINCIGKITQKTDNPSELLFSNSILPLEMSRKLKKSHILIHPSTDCVFNGITENPYYSFDSHSATDMYGISKSLGETALLSRCNTLIIRVSIIGPDLFSNKGLLSWFLNTKSGISIDGYTNHYWNGITTLEWCEKIFSFINDEKLENLISKKIIQLGTREIYNKYQMLMLFNKIYYKNINIYPVENKKKINRCLCPEVFSDSLENQLLNLKAFNNS
jgi:dTDP-4-dehydrorhamnose reductase